MHSFRIGINSHIRRLHKFSQDFIVTSDHLACVEKIEVWNSVIYLKNMSFELSGGHDR